MRLPALLAVDAGGSKIDAALLGRDGAIRGVARRQGLDHDGTVATGSSSASPTPCSRRAVTRGPSPITARSRSWGCTASRADLPADDRRIARWFRRRGLTEHDVVRNDTFAVLRAGTERPWGVAVVCGYGTNCSGIGPDGRSFRFPAFGETGDWGGGQDIGGAALWYAARAEDGRGEPTALRELVPRHFGFTRVRQLTEAMYFDRIPQRRVVESRRSCSAPRRRATRSRVGSSIASAGDRADGRGRDPPAADDAARRGRRARRRFSPPEIAVSSIGSKEGSTRWRRMRACASSTSRRWWARASWGSTGSRRGPRRSAAPGRRWRPPGSERDGPDGRTRRDDLMAKIVFEGVTKEFGGEVDRRRRRLPGDRRRRVHGPGRAVRGAASRRSSDCWRASKR